MQKGTHWTTVDMQLNLLFLFLNSVINGIFNQLLSIHSSCLQ